MPEFNDGYTLDMFFEDVIAFIKDFFARLQAFIDALKPSFDYEAP